MTKEQYSITPDRTSSSSKRGSLSTLKLQIEHQRAAFGLGTDRPRLSWIIETETQGWHQAGYEIEAYNADGKLRRQTGRVESDQSVLIDWPFEQLSSRERVTVRSQFDSMRAWVDWIASIAGERHLWDEGFQFGDWLDPAAPPERPGDARTDQYLVATTYFARSAELVGLSARALGLYTEEVHYLLLATKIREAFAKE